jgi:DNA polymerase III alpha subunit
MQLQLQIMEHYHHIEICKLHVRNIGIKPILGVEAYISPTDRFDRSSKTDKSIQAYNHIILTC